MRSGIISIFWATVLLAFAPHPHYLSTESLRRAETAAHEKGCTLCSAQFASTKVQGPNSPDCYESRTPSTPTVESGPNASKVPVNRTSPRQRERLPRVKRECFCRGLYWDMRFPTARRQPASGLTSTRSVLPVPASRLRGLVPTATRQSSQDAPGRKA